ncbi:tetrahydrocannabinolic acid synthase-like [Panicum miliaceum]|uniref:Tetrahydrocannabinolic acid synthase-like n=1 Tax=Panicum miliaceum TaxID=4540 RepID=A0A3L6PFN3_PANMI|nr:tetrahydrocannabinolic acid synthase-like [Panicum miliaceum]
MVAIVRRSFALSLLAAFFAVLHRAASVAPAAPSSDAASFLRCLAVDLPPQVVYTNASPSYSSVLESSIKNLLFVAPATPMPVAIVAAADASHVQAAVRCGARHGVRVRPRSGGHDYEGLSYRALSAARPFAVVDLAAFRDVCVDAGRRTAWVGSGATLGELYYAIANRSARLGFPGGVGPTVGVGGHLSGGGFGLLLRKHGLAADHVVDAVIVDAEGRLLDRAAMGEDLFWAIRGGGGGSFSVVLRWKLRLVRVPATVAVFTVHRPRNQSATALVTRWQRVAPALPRDVFLRVVLQNQDAQFESLYLGTCAGLVATMAGRFPELGVTPRDCIEMTWIESVLYFAFYGTEKSRELLLFRGTRPERYFKAKSDYVSEPVPSHVWESAWSWFLKDGAGLLILDPYGGRMGAVSPLATPFPHRRELFNLQYYGFWFENGTEVAEKHIGWIRGLHTEMEPYVSKNPRGAYVNYRDLDLGVNGDDDDGGVSGYEKARAWGEMYFKANFERLAAVKAKVDPRDFFRNEQSIPPLPSSRKGLL